VFDARDNNDAVCGVCTEYICPRVAAKDWLVPTAMVVGSGPVHVVYTYYIHVERACVSSSPTDYTIYCYNCTERIIRSVTVCRPTNRFENPTPNISFFYVMSTVGRNDIKTRNVRKIFVW